jgi:CubicO group peptidase (beta-lactamase class C family)
MNRRDFLAGLAALTISARSIETLRGENKSHLQDINGLLEAIRKRYELPALVAAAVRGTRLVAEGAVGVRRVGKPDKVTLDDRFLIGSCTKDMTVLMICCLVDAGQLDFGVTLGDALPGVKMRDEYRPVTLTQLLTFRGGIQPYTQIGPRLTPILFEQGPAEERRARFVAHVLGEKPIVKPGTAKRYSNASYILAAYVAAQKTKASYEMLVAKHVFQPLDMASAGFGHPRTKERPNEPSFHVKRGQGYTPLPDENHPPEAILAPAGGCHCSIRDFAKFAAHQLVAARGKDPLLKPATSEIVRKTLRAEGPGGGVSFGGTPWLHAGYETARRKDFAVVVATNCGAGDDACEAVFKAVRERLAIDRQATGRS